jgi:hypothetical protein
MLNTSVRQGSAVIAVALAFALAACSSSGASKAGARGGSSTSTAGSTAPATTMASTTTTAPVKHEAQEACGLLSRSDMSHFVGVQTGKLGTTTMPSTCQYQLHLSSGSLIVDVSLLDDSSVPPDKSSAKTFTPETSLGDYGALMTSGTGQGSCIGGTYRQWFEIRLGGTLIRDPNGPTPWIIGTPSQRAAFLTMCQAAFANL